MNDLEPIKRKIYEIRGYKVMLDSDLAELYNVETKNLKRAVRANIERFPDDFMFELTKEEYDSLRCKNFTLNNRGGNRYLPQKRVLLSSDFFHPFASKILRFQKIWT